MGETPEVVESDDDQEADVDEEPEPTTEDAAELVEEANAVDGTGDVDEATVDLSDDDLGGGLFDGVEESTESEAGQESVEADSGGDETSDETDDVADGLSGNQAEMEEAINDGAARLAIVGLTEADFEDSDLDKDGLEEEFRETFAAFRLGYFGSRAVDEYLLEPADEDVSPAWGLAGSALMAAAMVAFLRPDGDEKMGRFKEEIGKLSGGML